MQIQIKNNTLILQADSYNDARIIDELADTFENNDKLASFERQFIPDDYYKLAIYLGLKN